MWNEERGREKMEKRKTESKEQMLQRANELNSAYTWIIFYVIGN